MESNCPICLEDVVGKIRACPDTCDHIFCLPCLEKWSKLGSYCPVDRKRYKKILNLDSDDTIQVKPRKRKKTRRTLYDISTLCEVCSKDNNPGVLLLCDCCDLGFHMYCLSPPLKTIPAGAWNCPTCDAVEKKLKDTKGITKEVEVDLFSNVQEINSYATISEIGKASSKKYRPTQTSEECDQVINDYEEISVQRNFGKNICCSNLLDDNNDFNNIDKIYKTFNYETQSCRQKASKYCKTYDLLSRNKKNVSKTLPRERIHTDNNLKLQSSNVDEMCLKSGISENINLSDDYLFKGGAYGCMKPDKLEDDAFQSCYSLKIEVNEDHTVNECSETNSLHHEALKNTDNSQAILNSSINDNDFQEEYPNIDTSLEEEMQSNPKPVVNENAEDLQSSYNHISVSKSSPKENQFKIMGQCPLLGDCQPKVLLSKCSVLNSNGGGQYDPVCERDVEAKFSVPKPSNRYFENFGANSNMKHGDKFSFDSKNPVTVETEFKSEPSYKYAVNCDVKSESYSGFKKESSNNYESAFIGRQDLKFLKILRDGTFFIDKPTRKDDKTLVKPSQSSGYSNSFDICKTIKREEFKYLTILKNGTLFLESPNIKKEKSETMSFQNSENYDDCSESKAFYRNESKYCTVKGEVEEKPGFERDNASIKTLQESEIPHCSHKIIHKTDLQYLTIKENGSLVLDLPS